jgi:hypothetical protein
MPMAEPTTAVGVFDSRDQAEQALLELKRAGFRADQVGFALRGEAQRADPAAPGESRTNETTTPGPGSLAGAVGESAVGIIPGLGAVTTGGPLTGILGGAAAGALAGGLFGSLLGLGVPESTARNCARAFQAGQPLVLVRANGRAAEAAALLRRHGAADYPRAREGSVGSETGRAVSLHEGDAERRA